MISNDILTDDLKYLIKYDTHYSHNCETYKCDYICRCGVLTSCDITIDVGSLLNLCEKYSSGTDIEKYLDFWYLKNTIKSNDFEYHSCSGYYGEELSRINLITLDLSFNNLSISDKIRYLLTLEYKIIIGLLQPYFTPEYTWEIKNVNISDVISNITPNKNKTIEYYKSIHFHLNKVSELEKNKYKNIFVPLCIPDINKYKVIDGHHRFLAWKLPIHKKLGTYYYQYHYSFDDLFKISSTPQNKKEYFWSKNISILVPVKNDT